MSQRNHLSKSLEMSTYTDPTPVKIILIGVGGATNCGKTTLSKHLRNCLPNSFIIHQDDFAPPIEQLPIHPELGVADWDDPPGAVDWDRFAKFLSDFKKTGTLPDSHKSFDEFNTTPSVPIPEEITTRWKDWGESFIAEHLQKHGRKIIWAIVDGFLMFWDESVVSSLDVRVLIRTPEAIVRQRREDRPYVTAEGEVWRDPPQYWEKVVWPAYIRAHQHLFENGDVVTGKLSEKAGDLILLEGDGVKFEDMVNTVMERIVEVSVAG